MKRFLPLLLAVLALPLFQSCVGPGYSGASYGAATNYGSSAGIISTSDSRWGYDPYYRSYYDYSLGQYYNLNSNRYYTTLPRRYSTAFYPSNYRRGSTLRASTRLPHLNTRFSRSSVGFASTSNSRWSYDPYRRSYYDNQQKRYFNTSSGSYYNNLPRRYSSPTYPSGHRSGQRVQLHSRLPNSGNQNDSQRNRNFNNNQRSDQRNSDSRNRRPEQGNSDLRDQRSNRGNSDFRNQRSNQRNSDPRNGSLRDGRSFDSSEVALLLAPPALRTHGPHQH